MIKNIDEEVKKMREIWVKCCIDSDSCQYPRSCIDCRLESVFTSYVIKQIKDSLIDVFENIVSCISDLFIDMSNSDGEVSGSDLPIRELPKVIRDYGICTIIANCFDVEYKNLIVIEKEKQNGR